MILHTFGDSISLGYGVYGASFPSLLADGLGASLLNRAVSGAMVPDQAAYVYGSNLAPTDVATLMLGTNDERIYGESELKCGLFQSGLAALAAFIAASPIKAINAGTYAGAWGDTYAYGVGKNSYVQGSRCTFSVSGTTVLIGYIRQASNHGQFSVKIDGVLVGVYSNNGDGITSAAGVSYGPALLRFPGLADGVHTVEIEVVSATSASNRVYVDWWAGNKVGTPVKIANTPYALAYSSGGTRANVDAYNEAIAQVVSDLASDGLSVELIDVNSALGSADMSDDYHPNAEGHKKMFRLFKGGPAETTFTAVSLLLGSDGKLYYLPDGGAPQVFTVPAESALV